MNISPQGLGTCYVKISIHTFVPICILSWNSWQAPGSNHLIAACIECSETIYGNIMTHREMCPSGAWSYLSQPFYPSMSESLRATFSVRPRVIDSSQWFSGLFHGSYIRWNYFLRCCKMSLYSYFPLHEFLYYHRLQFFQMKIENV